LETTTAKIDREVLLKTTPDFRVEVPVTANKQNIH